MEKRLKRYIEYLGNAESADRDLVLAQISFFQHERLIHLLVLILFSILTITCVIVSVYAESLMLLVLDFILLLVMVFYIRHYYILENGVQTLYREFDRLFDRR